MANPWKQFSELLPQRPITVGRVTKHNNNGTTNIFLPGGTTIQVTGQEPIGQRVFIQDGDIQSEAPSNLVEYEIEI